MATEGRLFQLIRDRVDLDREEGDIAYFHALIYYGEFLTKVVASGVVACIGDDADRHRYTLEHQLVRANGVGDWSNAINNVFTGRASNFLLPAAREVLRDLSERVVETDWQYVAVEKVKAAEDMLNLDGDSLGSKAALRQFFPHFANLRNKRSHGAPTGQQCSDVCTLLRDALDLIAGNLGLFKEPWAYLHRNLSGKYRVSCLAGDPTRFDYLKSTKEVRLAHGTYIFLDRPIHVPLIFTDVDTVDIFVPNGEFRSGTIELKSYITNTSRHHDASDWMTPPSRLPESHTEGKPILEPHGGLFANFPPMPRGYIRRPLLESDLLHELATPERHPIVTLTGSGGIGKTTVALAVLELIAKLSDPPYGVVIWLSARDIDLLETGAKPVSPRVVDQRDMALAVVQLLEPAARDERGFDSLAYFQDCLQKGAAGPTLFVIDNFETVQNTADLFRLLDTHVRPPNKVLITTRYRDFAGDYPIEVSGMTDDEASELIEREAARLGISHLLSTEYIRQLITEADAHPYVMKILLGEVATIGRAVTPARIVAGKDQVLKALFERTYASLTPGAQRLFLLLSSWRVLVPEVAVEAVALRPTNERFDVQGALDELRRFSLMDEVISEKDGESFVGVPLAASIFGGRKLEASPFKVAVEADRKLLMEFGAGKREDARHGVFPRIEKLVEGIARRANEQGLALESALPVLEYLASRVPRTNLVLASLFSEEESSPDGIERAKHYLRNFLETAEPHEREPVWRRLADVCRMTDDATGEVHALSEIALLPGTATDTLSEVANRINNRIRDLRGRRIEEAWSPEVKMIIERVTDVMERHLANADADYCSRLAWLYINIGNEARAREVAKAGLKKDPSHYHCRNLLAKYLGR
jgi:hypothetical protein